MRISQSLESPIVRAALITVAAAPIFVLIREARKIPAKLFALMATAFIDMVGLLIILPEQVRLAGSSLVQALCPF